MAFDILPDQLIVRDRSEWEAAYLRSYRLRDPEADTRADTQPSIDAKTLADQLVVQSQNARRLAQSIPLSEVTGDRLDQRLVELGLPPRFPDLGSSGFVIANTSTGGAHIFAGDELTTEDQGLRFQCITEGDYSSGDYVPVAAIDAGPQTNLDAGTLLIWSFPRPGCAPTAEIAEQTDEEGLSGGRLAESDDEVRQRVSDTLADPAATGNDAGYRRFAENSRGHGVPVQRAFSYPCILGPGTTCVVFTMKPQRPGASRIPNATQIQQVRDYVIGQMPGDDGYLDGVLLADPTDIVLEVSWSDGAAGWTDATTWPPRYNVGNGAVVVSAVTDATTFTLIVDNGDYNVPDPVVGQTIGFFDPVGVFRRKKIATIGGSGPWVITCNVVNAASDTGFVPVVGQRAMPWSDSLDTLVAPVVAFFEALGPGEQRATFFDPGVREKRNPPSPRYWPSTITNRIITDILDTAGVADARVQEGLDVTATVGTPGAISYLLELDDLAAFPLLT
ncbi:MAG: baseplate J/gp47 family protein [Gemmatimonadaceae bacterium]|nr:baseplate J/gp47 family protein [Gemmatimonadaceae bacterium]